MLICTMKSLLICVILIFISVDSVLTSTSLLLHEGEDVYLKYNYDIVNILQFQLQKGQEDAFFKYGQICADNLNPSQQKRFFVNALHSESKRFMLVALTVNNAERTDAGTYSCKLIEDGKVVANSTKIISLYVEFPPDPVDCWFLPPHTEYERDILQCAAKGGSPPGEITCFQNEKKALPLGLHQDMSNGTHIHEKFWVDRNLPVSCCSHPGFHIQSNTCHDFEQHPLHIVREKVTIATSQLMPDILTIDTSTRSSKTSLNLAIVIPVSTFILIIIIVTAIVIYLKCFKNEDQSSDDDKHDGITKTESEELLSGTEKGENVKNVCSKTNDKIKSNDKIHTFEMKDSPKTVFTKTIENESRLQDDNQMLEFSDEKQTNYLSSDPPPCEPPTTTDHSG